MTHKDGAVIGDLVCFVFEFIQSQAVGRPTGCRPLLREDCTHPTPHPQPHPTLPLIKPTIIDRMPPLYSDVWMRSTIFSAAASHTRMAPPAAVYSRPRTRWSCVTGLEWPRRTWMQRMVCEGGGVLALGWGS